MHLVDRIALCTTGFPPQKTRLISNVDQLRIHRCEGSLEQLAKDFKDTSRFAAGSYTGGQFPYHYHIDEAGVVAQCLPLTASSPGAIGVNYRSIHIVVQGDFRKRAPTPAQAQALAAICAALSMVPQTPPEILGHTETEGTSKDVSKICPGKYLDLPALRRDVRARLSLRSRYEHAGFRVF